MQKLNIVPQTLFLRPRPAERISSRIDVGRTFSDQGRRTPVSRLSRAGSIDQPAGQLTEDLRRRLTQQTSALSITTNRTRLEGPPGVTSPLSDVHSLRPPSPTESATSHTDATNLLRNYRHGSVDSRKAAPAIGSIRTNATGVMESSAKLRSLDEEPASGRTSPASAAGTLRGDHRGRISAMQPVFGAHTKHRDRP